MRIHWYLSRLVWSVTLAGASLFFSTQADEVVVDGHPFTVAAGFTVERVAGPPLTERPITAGFDERGRLYVAESSGTNDSVKKQQAERPHSILRLEDSNGDGQFDRRTVFVDQIMFPEGTLWHNGSLYVCAPPEIWKFTDTNDDGVADRREIWFDAKTLTGCANDLHGPYLGPEGYIYWCKGAFAEQTYSRPGKPDFKTRASHIFRRRADGNGPIESVMTGGMDNPVDVVFTPEGERIFTTTFLVHPGGGQRDGLIHAIFGGIYGKDHDPIHEPAHVWTSPELMPPLVHLGPAAPSGLTRYESTAFGPGYQDNLFACSFNMHKVTRHVLTPRGSTFEATTEDFLSSTDVDFHPTDILEDADGSLLVVNTGGWYKLCCPTSQLHKPDVLGGIYRVRRIDAPKLEDPRGESIDWNLLSKEAHVEFLEDERPWVQQLAIQKLTNAALPESRAILGAAFSERSGLGPRGRMNSVWAASRNFASQPVTPAAQEQLLFILGQAVADPDPGVRQSALNALVAFGLKDSLKPTHLLTSASELNRRGAAELIGTISDPSDVGPIFAALARDNDRALDHALTYALILIGNADATFQGLSHSHPRVRRAAMVALDQMGSADRLDTAAVAGWMLDSDQALSASAAWVVGRHPEWGGSLAGFFGQQLQKNDLTPAAKLRLSGQLARLAGGAEIQALLTRTVADFNNPNQNVGLRAMAASELKTLPLEWAKVLSFLLNKSDPEPLELAIAALKGPELPQGPGQEIVQKLKLLGSDEAGALPPTTRLAALGCLPEGLELPAEIYDSLLKFQANDQPVALRLAAIDVLVKAKLTADQLFFLSQVVRTAGPLELTRILPAYGKSDEGDVGLRLIESLEECSSAKTLRAEQLDPILKSYPEAVKEAARAFIASNQVGQAEQEQRLDGLLKNLPAGDVRRGHQVFASAKAACNTCHAMGYLGGRVGPDLTRIGQIRTDHDLLEAIVYPSSSFVRSYEPLTVSMLDGRVVSGLVSKDTAEELVLTVAAEQTVSLNRSEIEEIKPGTVSIMPAGLDQQLSTQELADLLAFLKAAR